MVALSPPTSLRWLFLDLNSYFASVEQQCRPELRGKPVAVVPLETDSTCAIAASYEAKAYGIKTGTLIYEAKRLCPELICIKADHARYVEYHHRILEEIEHYLPITEVASIDEVACALDRTQRTPESAAALAHAIKTGIRNHVGDFIRCSIGLAPNRFLAKVATELEKPDGLVTILPEDIPGKLLSLTLRDIPGIGSNMQHRLEANGITTMEDLYRLEPKHMRAIWHSVAGERMWYHLRGIELERTPSERHTVGHSHVLAPENRPYSEAERIAKRLLLKAASRLRRMGYRATAMHIAVRIEQGPRLKADLHFHATGDNTSLLHHYTQCWEKMMKASPSHAPRIKKIAITLQDLVASNALQPDLFAATESGKGEARHQLLSTTVDAINQRFGRNTITSAATLGEANRITGTKIAFSRIPESAEFQE